MSLCTVEGYEMEYSQVVGILSVLEWWWKWNQQERNILRKKLNGTKLKMKYFE